MSLLDLQKLEKEDDAPRKAPPPGSRASKGCNASNLSLLLC
jgi:hypothetical protein